MEGDRGRRRWKGELYIEAVQVPEAGIDFAGHGRTATEIDHSTCLHFPVNKILSLTSPGLVTIPHPIKLPNPSTLQSSLSQKSHPPQEKESRQLSTYILFLLLFVPLVFLCFAEALSQYCIRNDWAETAEEMVNIREAFSKSWIKINLSHIPVTARESDQRDVHRLTQEYKRKKKKNRRNG